MSASMDDPVYQRLMKALSGIVDSLKGEQEAYASFLDLLIRNEWAIKEHQREQAVDSLRLDLTRYIELLEEAATQATQHMDSVLDGVGPVDLCDRMEAFAQLLKTKQALQISVGHGVKEQLGGLPSWSDGDEEDS